MPIGIVTFFSDVKGFGFIRPLAGGTPIFVHTSAVKEAGLPGLTIDQYVNFNIRTNSVRQFAEGIRLENTLAFTQSNVAPSMSTAFNS